MKSKLRLIFCIALAVIVADHATKALIVRYLRIGSEIPVLAGLFDIVHTRNTGAAFGMLSGWDSPFRDWFFYAVGLAAFVFLYHYVKGTHETDRISLTGLGLIGGGALGNLTDRLWRGSVVDFLSVHFYDEVATFSLFGRTLVIPLTWPAFNVADSAICVGVGLLLLQSLKTPPPAK